MHDGPVLVIQSLKFNIMDAVLCLHNLTNQDFGQLFLQNASGSLSFPNLPLPVAPFFLSFIIFPYFSYYRAF